jgi:hypothetical protein
MSRSSNRLDTLASLVALAAAGVLSACGGEDTPPTPPVTVSGVVADGPLSGATACYDLNDNAACDAGEPSSPTDTDGRYSFEVAAAVAGAHAVIVDVPATAVDKDTGAAVGTAFTLKSPPTGTAGAQTIFVSPLTTLVVDVAAAQGITPAAAVAQVQGQLGLSASPLANFVAGSDAQAATFARTLNTVRIEIAKLGAAANLDATTVRALVESVTTADLAGLAARIESAAGTTAAAIAAEVAALVIADQNLSPDTIDEQAEIARAFATSLPASPPGPFFSIRRFTWTDAANHQLQAFVGDSTLASGSDTFPVSETRVHLVGGVAQTFNRNTAYWVTATQSWAVCPREWELMRVTPQTATAPQKSVFCQASVTLSKVAEYDVAGQKMADVVAKVRASSRADTPGFDTDANGLPIKWGPAPATLGETVFPDGARFSYREQTNEVGDTERYSLTDKPRVIPASGTGTYRHAPTIEALKRMSGNWVDTTASVTNLNAIYLDDLAFAQSNTAYKQIKRYRAAFDPASDKVRFFACDVLVSNDTSLNCEAIGDGTTTITAQADSRVLRFATGYPAALKLALLRQRQFVERDGVVFGGNRDFQRTRFQHRPNTIAWNALRTALGMAEPAAPTAPVVDPTAASLARFTFTDINNYSYRTFRGGTPAADGTQTLLEQWDIVSGGVPQPWQRNALYWTGSTWYACPDDPNAEPVAVGTFNDALGTDDYCQTYKSSERRRSVVTLDGRNVQEVLRDIRWYPTKDNAYDYAGFGPNPDATPSIVGAVFPAGSTMTYQSSRRDATPFVLYTTDNDRVRTAPSADTTAAFATWPLAATLEDVIAKNPGDFYPIIAFSGQLTGNITQGVTNWFLAAPTDPLYTTEVAVRVAFDPVGQKARFFMHNRLASNNNSVNYVKLLDTTYTIETAGDARVLRFAALPAEVLDRLAGERLFVERAGQVRFGSKDAIPEGRRVTLRLNEAAAIFLGSLLGIN